MLKNRKFISAPKMSLGVEMVSTDPHDSVDPGQRKLNVLPLWLSVNVFFFVGFLNR